jgi:hypothetical protein
LRSAGSCGSRKLERNQFVTDAAPFKGRVKIKAAQLENKLGIMDAGGSVMNSFWLSRDLPRLVDLVLALRG